MATDIETPEAETQTKETTYTKAEQQHYAEIRAMERKVAELLTTSDADKSIASASKKAFEAADGELRALIHRGPDDQLTLPGMGPEAELQDPSAVPIGDIGLTEKQIEQFAEAGVKMIGEFNALVAEHGEHWRKHVKGMGEKGAEKVADLFVKFWEAHPEYCQEPEPARVPTKIRLKQDVPDLGEAGEEFEAPAFGLSAGKPFFIDSDEEEITLEPEDYEVVTWEEAGSEDPDNAC
jgi:hypothetical protein